VLAEAGALEARVGAGKFEDALRREIARRLGRLADGVLAYRQNPFHRTLDNPPAVWSEGNTRLLDYGATHRSARVRGARAVLVVPSPCRKVTGFSKTYVFSSSCGFEGCGRGTPRTSHSSVRKI